VKREDYQSWRKRTEKEKRKKKMNHKIIEPKDKRRQEGVTCKEPSFWKRQNNKIK